MAFVFVILTDNLFELVCLLVYFSLQEIWRTYVSVANAPCLRMMTTLHACNVCMMAAGECNLDIENPYSICEGWTSKQWGKLRRSLVDARASASQRGRQHWSAAFPRLEAWILSRPVSASSSGPTSEISSQAGEGDFKDNLLVSMPSPLVQQVLVVQAQNEVNMASGTATTAPSMATTAPSKAPLPLAGPSTLEPIVPIGVQLGAQDTPSVIQGARPVVSTEQTMQSIQSYGSLLYYPRGTCTATRPSQASPKRAEHTLASAQDLEAFKSDMTLMLSDMLQASLSKFASQFNPSSGGQGDSAPTQTVASERTSLRGK